MKPVAKALVEGARLHSFVVQALERMDPAIGATLSHALTVEERLALTYRLYEDSPHYRNEDLWGFENDWFANRLPKPPARLLVGACGGGREAWWLEKQGYDVDAFDQVAGMVERARAKAVRPSQYAAFSYQDLAAHVLRGVDGGDRPGSVPAGFLRAPYDAILLGWGSLIHVLDPTDRAELFAAADRLTEGPILASFYLRDEQPGPEGRSIRYGSRVGTAIARLRGIDPRTSRAECYTASSGFGLRFTRAEIEDLARSVGREVIWEHRHEDEFPHATFVRNGTWDRGADRSRGQARCERSRLPERTG